MTQQDPGRAQATSDGSTGPTAGSSGARRRGRLGRLAGLLGCACAVLLALCLQPVQAAAASSGPGAHPTGLVPAAAVDTWAPRTATCQDTRRSDCTRLVTFPVGGRIRWAYVYLPPAATRGPVSMVVAAHGLRMTPRSFDDITRFTALARRAGFAVTFPQGYGVEDGGHGYQAGWNAGTCCGPAARDQIDDMAMMNATVSAARKLYRSNGRFYFVGFSNGAMLGYRLWCQDGGPFRALVAVDGTRTVPSCRPRTIRPFLAVHSLLDTTVPFTGCRTSQAGSSCATKLYTDLPSSPAVVWSMRVAAGCTGSRARRFAPHVIVSVSVGCARSAPVHMTVDNAAHVWVTDARRYGIDETALSWTYLRQW